MDAVEWRRLDTAGARVHAVKFMWGLFACNELMFRRFKRGSSAECAVCPGETESAWHVMGTCGCEQAVALRRQWADRMWKEVSQEMTQGKNPLDRRVADAVARRRGAAGCSKAEMHPSNERVEVRLVRRPVVRAGAIFENGQLLASVSY